MADSKIAAAAAKPNLWLLPVRAHGFKNYLKAAEESDITVVIERYLAAVLRHLEAYQEGEVADSESGLPHIDHMLAGLTMLRHILIVTKQLDADPGAGNEPPGSLKARVGAMTAEESKALVEELKTRSEGMRW